jgi:hypothetical protein
MKIEGIEEDTAKALIERAKEISSKRSRRYFRKNKRIRSSRCFDKFKRTNTWNVNDFR